MSDWVDIQKDEQHIARERAKAKELRKSQWWQNRLNKGICHYCGRKFPRDELTMDHIVPLARGGKSTKANIVPCCKECNNKKQHLTPVEMLLMKNALK
ncbi:MAG: HNH endonuclease [Fidelibacterota bacterium]